MQSVFGAYPVHKNSLLCLFKLIVQVSSLDHAHYVYSLYIMYKSFQPISIDFVHSVYNNRYNYIVFDY